MCTLPFPKNKAARRGNCMLARRGGYFAGMLFVDVGNKGTLIEASDTV